MHRIYTVDRPVETKEQFRLFYFNTVIWRA